MLKAMSAMGVKPPASWLAAYWETSGPRLSQHNTAQVRGACACQQHTSPLGCAVLAHSAPQVRSARACMQHTAARVHGGCMCELLAGVRRCAWCTKQARDCVQTLAGAWPYAHAHSCT